MNKNKKGIDNFDKLEEKIKNTSKKVESMHKQVIKEMKDTKTLNNTTANQAKDQVSDIETWGNSNMWQLLCKASSKNEGWMKSTKAMYIPDLGCSLQITTQQGDNVAEAVTFIPGAKIRTVVDPHTKKLIGRELFFRKNR